MTDELAEDLLLGVLVYAVTLFAVLGVLNALH